ncbi:MAG: hypothetical protein LUG24_05625 [Clostridiales bacterium]|nr:hypothetical protein [Clostridiales bacterium]
MRDISSEAASLYEGTFTAYEFISVTDETTGIVTSVKTEYITDEPCRISYESINENKQSPFPGYKSQKAKLFCSPSVEVKAGSEVVVTQNGISEEFVSSGAAAVYVGHSEVILNIKNVG